MTSILIRKVIKVPMIGVVIEARVEKGTLKPNMKIDTFTIQTIQQDNSPASEATEGSEVGLYVRGDFDKLLFLVGKTVDVQ